MRADRLLRLLPALVFVLLGVILLRISIDQYSSRQSRDWRRAIHSDAAGYYVYLPALFQYGMDASQVPEASVDPFGLGFYMNRQAGKFRTKYTYGVAVFEAPFYALVHLSGYYPYGDDMLAGREGATPRDGFSVRYDFVLQLASVFWVVMGLVLLRLVLLRYFGELRTWAVLLLILFGTNLYYYAVEDVGYSHVCSFFTFSWLLLAWHRWLEDPERRWGAWVQVAVALGLLVLLRPTNLLMALVLPFVQLGRWQELPGRLLLILQPKRILLVAGIAIAWWIPQMLYWHYLSGSFILYSYGEEGFPNWASPVLGRVWFSTNNGLFPYAPLWALMLVGTVAMVVRRIPLGAAALGLFLLVSYISGAWHAPEFGCSFGARVMIDYLPLFAIGLGHFLGVALRQRIWWRVLPYVPAIAAVVVCVRLTHNWNYCYDLSKSNFDWEEYHYFLSTRPYTGALDFEDKAALKDPRTLALADAPSGAHVYLLDSAVIYTPRIRFRMSLESPVVYRQAVFEVWMRAEDPDVHAAVVLNFEVEGQQVGWHGVDLPYDPARLGQWQRHSTNVYLPKDLKLDTVIEAYMQTLGPERKVWVDGLRVRFY